MNILDALKQLRDDIKTWVTNNLNALNAKIDEKTIPIDNKLNTTSTNPVQNKVITNAINNIPRFSGDYNDLTNAPNITEDESGNMIIADESGNIIFKVDANGTNTTALILNGEKAATEEYVDAAIAELPTPDVSGQINEHNVSGTAHEDIRQAIINTKEELSESIVAESEEWKVVDGNGNIIFSVDADGAHTTELTLDGKEAATKEYVDNVFNGIEIPETDFTGYATEEYVDNAIAAIPETDLSNYYTKEETDTTIEELSESIVSNSSEWKVVDNSGNIIFSVDADGAHTTNLTLNGESVRDIATGAIADWVGSAPEKLNTLDELAAALNDDPNFATTVITEISKKVEKVEGKGLSTNDFTNEYKEKLEGLENIVIEETDPTVPDWAKEPTKPSYTADEVGALSKTTALFSGDYNDLRNAPNIYEDNSGDLVITDNNGNIIFKTDANGFETTQLTVNNLIINGKSIGELIQEYVNAAIAALPRAEEASF